MLRKRDLSSDKKGILREDPETVTALSQINEDALVFVRDFDLFVTLRFLDETSAVLLLQMLCSKHGYSFEWKNGETPRLANHGKSITCTLDNFVLLVVPGLSSIPAAVCLQHRDQRISNFSEHWDCYQIQSRLEVTSVHAGSRCWQILTSRPRETVNQHTKIFLNEMYKEDPTEGIPDWLQPFTVNLEDLEMHVFAHSSERENSDSEGDASKVEAQKMEAQNSY